MRVEIILLTFTLIGHRTKQEHLIYSQLKQGFAMRQVVMDVASGMVLAGFVSMMTIWMMVISG